MSYTLACLEGPVRELVPSWTPVTVHKASKAAMPQVWGNVKAIWTSCLGYSGAQRSERYF